MKTLKKVFAITLLFLFLTSFVPDDGDRLVGLWEPSNGKVRVKIEKIGSKYFGKIVWLREPLDPTTKAPKVDKNNPDESMRNVPIKGYRLLKDFSYSEKDEWKDGTIYDPENGSVYNCVINMKDENTLDIRGYIGVKALGRTDVWKRIMVIKK
jgi:uncharacterized protein (DUF2147 family)